MDFDLTADQKLYRTTARDFLEKQMPLTRVRELGESGTGFERDWWRQGSELGWNSMLTGSLRGQHLRRGAGGHLHRRRGDGPPDRSRPAAGGEPGRGGAERGGQRRRARRADHRADGRRGGGQLGRLRAAARLGPAGARRAGGPRRLRVRRFRNQGPGRGRRSGGLVPGHRGGAGRPGAAAGPGGRPGSDDHPRAEPGRGAAVRPGGDGRRARARDQRGQAGRPG